MKKLFYIILSLVLMACDDEINTSPALQDGMVLTFEAVVIDQPQSRGQILNVNDNTVTRDFKAGDSFGLFIIDGAGDFVSLIDGKNAKNIKLTTPDGKAWNLNSDIKEVVHKLGYRYVAYFPYSEAFNDCASTADIQSLLTAPDVDQSTQEATDWMYTDITSPKANAVTTLKFLHRYAKIDIYNSFTQDHSNSWASAYQYTKTVDDSNVEHYRYIVDATTPQTLTVNGKYSIGDELTGIKEFTYDCGDITIENGRHAIIYTYRMDERCAIDLGLPSGVLWSPINLGTETSTYMDPAAIASLGNVLGLRLAWGELYEKDTYNYDTYINDPYLDTKVSVLPADISGTVYDPARQYWGGHWALPTSADIQELIDSTDVVSTETVYSDELGKEINKITLRSKVNNKEITFLTNGYATNATVNNAQYLYYMSASIGGYAYCGILHNNPSMRVTTNNRYIGYSIRPVLKELYIYTNTDKKGIVVKHIDDLAVDLGFTKTVTEDIDGVPTEVTYKLLWSPFNYGAETRVALQTYNNRPIDEGAFLKKCLDSPGMRLAWGYTEETTYFNTTEYESGPLVSKYNFNNDASTPLDTRDLKYEDDIVQLNWPSGWYIPTAMDLQLLCLHTTVSRETINGRSWFKLTGDNGNSILIPPTNYIDDTDNTEKWGSDAYLQSSTAGLYDSKKHTIYALNLSGTSASLANKAGRPTGLMIRPVKYVRIK
ncbi:MAG: fimbrillin family protein [Muribaculaceae bacterium]